MRRMLAAATAVAALAAVTGTAAATIVLRVSPRELADRAGLVVEGRVAAVDVRWDADRTCIHTWATISVERTHKGANAASIQVKVPGGRVGDDELRVEGTAKFEAGEECFLFLWKDRAGDWLVLGEGQGKFRITQDAKTGVRTAENSVKGLCLVAREDPKTVTGTRVAGPDPRKADCLARDDLAAVVAASVEAARKASTGGSGTTLPAGSTTGTTGTTGSATGGVPAPQPAAPEPPSTTTPDGGAPPPTKDAPAPPAGSSGTSTDGTTTSDGKPKPPEPAPEAK